MSTHSRGKKKKKKNNNNNNVYSLNRDRVARVVKPQTTFRQVLVHLKDKVDKQKKKGGVEYKIPWNQHEKVYIGKKGRQLRTRITENRKEAEKISDRNFTRSTRRASSKWAPKSLKKLKGR